MSVSPRLRLLGLLCLLGGILQLSDTPLDLWWSAPTSPVHAAARLIWAIANFALIGGPIGIIAYRFVSPGWLTIAGAGVSIAGMLSQASGMISYLVFPNSSAGQILTPSGGILIALGMVVLGSAALLRKKLSGWQAWTPLLVGLYFIVQLAFIQIPFFLSKGHLIFAPLVDLWGFFWILLGVVIVWSESVSARVPLAGA
ncbi:hypothetical protein KSF_031880 [Reticulibacter mediterranei]|uniref:DUF998 domain-containing protein n=1 Tax=Reticulibacter mediterranei TaxID=2778369 RepID=A0A8J3IIM6_9CHLR|nr:hypothetical protein [Reticulibacter mediterranei]GHO93140.1 hypothetical protein KSF_031880 [Reticulibacter mediterranei]